MVFFFKQMTAYEVRISDWSSDVCSSDLFERRTGGVEILGGMRVVRADQGRYALSAGKLQRAPNHGLMALMESVEIAQRNHAAAMLADNVRAAVQTFHGRGL